MPMDVDLAVRQRRAFRRGAPRVEKRADGKDVIRGVSPVYYRADDPGTEFELWPGLVERVRAGAAKKASEAGADVRSFYNHDPNQVLGRTVAGTLRLAETDAGLAYEVEPPDTQTARDLLQSMRRGDVDGSSYMYWVRRRTWEEDLERNLDILWLDEVEVIEVGPVAIPAYSSAGSELGKAAAGEGPEALRASYAAWLEERARANAGDLEGVRRRLRLLELRA